MGDFSHFECLASQGSCHPGTKANYDKILDGLCCLLLLLCLSVSNREVCFHNCFVFLISCSCFCQAGVPNFFEKSRRFVYKRIPVYDASTSAPQLESQAEEIASFISKGLFHGSVLVHCQHGVSRSTTCVVMYLMRCVYHLWVPLLRSSSPSLTCWQVLELPPHDKLFLKHHAI